jgi:hypothetical protein
MTRTPSGTTMINRPMADDANAALLAWYRHLATYDEIMRIRHELGDLNAKLPPQADSH